jgi:hypothetical protein
MNTSYRRSHEVAGDGRSDCPISTSSNFVVTLLDDSPDAEPQTLAEGHGLMDGDHRRGPFGGTYKVALMMDDSGGRDGHPRNGRRLTSRGFNRLPANVQGGRVRRRLIKFSAN